MKVAVGGSHTLDPAVVATHILQQLASLPIDAEVLLRGPLRDNPGPVEIITSQLCEALSIPVHWYLPKPGEGRGGVFDRDVQMAHDADAMLLYFHPDMTMEGGTGHLLERGMDHEKPIAAYVPREDAMELLGSIDPVPA